ncbi:hypothetical protein GSU3598 [Geobacter sulfurreducens PCA]|uniref:Uncharacterized protein n=1 Tax=Geobacter sulfurreducens (strain ATCC 51573 / DSM 12127 / PCA) TaxID=243231 RepID=I7FK82_GEOSL|nr:hypothetical protein GSU3522 [Geobacter sulfurreducens PCA]AFP20492.1 hypothetical protein GSU3598 [Geobacter sulfurreducens PCA]
MNVLPLAGNRDQLCLAPAMSTLHEWDGRGNGIVSKPRKECLRNRCSSNNRSELSFDKSLVQDSFLTQYWKSSQNG